MGFSITLRIAYRALVKNKMRAGLTVLGVVVGIAAVTTMVSIGQSASELVQSQLRGLGTNVILIFPGSESSGGVQQAVESPLTAEDGDAISEQCDSVIAVTPLVFTAGQAVYGNTNWSPREMLGVGRDYLIVRNWQLSRGAFFDRRDISSADKVCVIGHTIVTKLFQTMNPIGETIRIRNIPFRVIGVLEKKGVNLVGDDQDNVIVMPYSTVRKRLDGSSFDNVDMLMASAISVNRMSDAEQEINQLLLERHRIKPGQNADFEVQNTTEIANVLGVITGVMTFMLASIAAISLLVGGVGIMNIMLVAVTERTREIGIRMAVGARGKDILRQFLVESIMLSSAGGLIGILFGISTSVGATMLINSVTSGSKWPIVISLQAAIISMLFAGAVGMFFGYYPARRASQLDPIEALRYE